MPSKWCIVEESTGLVVNVISWDGQGDLEFPEGLIAIESDVGGMGWTYADGIFYPPIVPGPTDEELATSARDQRDYLLRFVYDPGINMALRALRMAVTPEDQSYAAGKVSELDTYAEALLAIPGQPGFPRTVDWPATPTK